MLSRNEMGKLRKLTPRSLLLPGSATGGDDARDALLAFLRADGADLTGVTLETISEPHRDDNARLSVHNGFKALQCLGVAERESGKRMPHMFDTREASVRPVHPALSREVALLDTAHRLEHETAALQLDLRAELRDVLQERIALAEAVEAFDDRAVAIYQELQSLKFRMVDPLVISGYWHGANVDPDQRREIALLFYLHECFAEPLLRAVAMVGGFRHDGVAVNPNHPAGAMILQRCEQNLRYRRKMIRKFHGLGLASVYLTPAVRGKPCFPQLRNGTTSAIEHQERPPSGSGGCDDLPAFGQDHSVLDQLGQAAEHPTGQAPSRS